MSKPLSFYGQLNYTEIREALKSGKIKASKIQTQKGEQIVFDINVWVHEEADQYNNNASVQMSIKKELVGTEKGPYVGNLKYKTPTTTEATSEDIPEDDDDLSF